MRNIPDRRIARDTAKKLVEAAYKAKEIDRSTHDNDQQWATSTAELIAELESHIDELKKQVVIVALATGIHQQQLSKHLHISNSTMGRIVKRIREETQVDEKPNS